MSSAIVNGLAGAGGGLIAQIITYPLQTVNTRQQTERLLKKGHSNGHEMLPSKSHPSGGTLVQMLQGVYYYFYQIFKNKAESIAMARKAKGLGDGNVSMVTWLAVAAVAG
uniref:Uncharacterized protein n=1 Tax=Opuntia streptacantha TaxID=393608 RepID=A0A7C8ZDJ4_OPUST